MSDEKPIIACSNCGEDRTDKGSLLYYDHVFCNEDCFEEWHSAITEKRTAESQRSE